MYKLVLYSLIGISAGAILLSIIGIISYNPIALGLSCIGMIMSAYYINMAFAKIWHAPTNPESAVITALILFLLLPPITTVTTGLASLAVITIAVSSKYIIAYKHRHLFNPAALALVIAPFITSTVAIWWVGSIALLPLTLIAGFLVVKKIRRYELVIACIIASIIGIIIKTIHLEGATFITPAILELFTSWPLIFMATIMLTEPITTPPTKSLQIIYGIIVGLLFTTPFNFGPIYSTPEFAPNRRQSVYIFRQS